MVWHTIKKAWVNEEKRADMLSLLKSDEGPDETDDTLYQSASTCSSLNDQQGTTTLIPLGVLLVVQDCENSTRKHI